MWRQNVPNKHSTFDYQVMNADDYQLLQRDTNEKIERLRQNRIFPHFQYAGLMD